jgi:hypothetical protein
MRFNGEMAERSIAAVLKTVEPRGSGGSNPSLSAINLKYQLVAKNTHGFTHIIEKDKGIFSWIPFLFIALKV